VSRPPVTRHYDRESLAEAILEALGAAGASPHAPSIEDLAPVDHFHTRGREATLELLALSAVGLDARVLDVGGGIGGSARLLASTAGCRVTVLDLTEEYVRTGRELTRRVGLSDRVAFVHGDALRAPFDSGAFDVVWTQHATMNVADKPAFYREVRRLLRPGGRLAMHEILAGPVQPIRFPVPWASDPAISHLLSPEHLRQLLAALGFSALAWQDQSAESLEFNRRRLVAARSAPTPPPVGLHLLLGPDYLAMFANQVANLEEERTRVVMGVWERGQVPGA
jgi:ubiquinone/menaquinone biosynthesis C-methylase UbiE